MATKTVRRRKNEHPMSYYWGLVQDMDDSQKLELIMMLAESVKPTVAVPPIKRYTMEEFDALIDAGEADIAAGRVIDDEDMWHDLDEEQEELEMAESV